MPTPIQILTKAISPNPVGITVPGVATTQPLVTPSSASTAESPPVLSPEIRRAIQASAEQPLTRSLRPSDTGTSPSQSVNAKPSSTLTQGAAFLQALQPKAVAKGSGLQIDPNILLRVLLQALVGGG